ncbi:hypothetical protein GCM10022199_25660 [Marihabitans asiaticum]|uniref:Uncharacterized protein n=1 Tax=Marihabitans asiaticum TaxID=415218 RepID=A0A560WGE3_9MICO|nr:hypothetical protein FB557_0288 [Marihabitans asiaticum]
MAQRDRARPSRLWRPRVAEQPLLTWVVDPLSETVRSQIGAVRDVVMAVHDRITVEVVLTGDHASSEHVAAGVIALLAADGATPVQAVEDVVRAHADEGMDVAKPSSFAAIAHRRSQDGEAVEIFAASDRARAMAREDRSVARDLGDPRDHALFFSGTTGVHRLPAPDRGARAVLAALEEVHPA